MKPQDGAPTNDRQSLAGLGLLMGFLQPLVFLGEQLSLVLVPLFGAARVSDVRSQLAALTQRTKVNMDREALS